MFSKQLEHQIELERAALGLTKDLRKDLTENDKLLIALIISRAFKITSVGTTRYKALEKRLLAERAAVMDNFEQKMWAAVDTLSRAERRSQVAILGEGIFTPNLTDISLEIRNTPFQVGESRSGLVGEWIRSLRGLDARRLKETLRYGVTTKVEPQALAQGVLRALGVTQTNAAAISLTMVKHVTETTKMVVWKFNSDKILALRWISVLDDRTSAICRSRSLHYRPLGKKPVPKGLEPLLDPPSARPPAHVRCRSYLMAVTSMDDPGFESYDEWLLQQSDETQDKVLGKAKGQMFREGKLTSQSLVDQTGRELRLNQL